MRRFFWASRAGSKWPMRVVTAATSAITASEWAFAATMGVVKGAVQAFAVSMWDFTATMRAV